MDPVIAGPSCDTDNESGQEVALIEAGGIDEEDEFVPSDYDEDSMSDTTSIDSSIYLHSYHGGRRYHRFRYIAFSANRNCSPPTSAQSVALTD